jgi:hypothetical protein
LPEFVEALGGLGDGGAVRVAVVLGLEVGREAGREGEGLEGGGCGFNSSREIYS